MSLLPWFTRRPIPAQPGEDRRAGPRARLERLVGRAELALGWERAWPVLWRGLGVVLVFVSASWLGLWLDIGPTARMVGVGLFAAALVAALAPLALLRRPARTAALDRLDREAGLAHGPARALEDDLALGADDPGSRALWALHLSRAEDALRRLAPPKPRPGMARRDRLALRAAAVVAVAASAFVAGPELGSRLTAAFDWREPAEPGVAFRIDGWVDPPLYTRLPPLVIDLARGEQRLRAPVGSAVVLRIAGRGEAAVSPGKGLQPAASSEAAQRPDLKEWRYALKGDAELGVRTGLTGRSRLVLEAVPDLPPEIIFAGVPEVNARGTFNLVYRGKDDYGIASAEALVERAGDAGKRSLVAPPRIALTLPSGGPDEADTRTLVDLTSHPWAGAKVKLVLVAKDAAEQEGRSATLEFTLPQRPFTKPLARALAEQRRKLVLDPDDRRWVQTALDAVLIAPDQFTPQVGVYLGLKVASDRLRKAKADEDLVEVADWLWAIALQIEEGDLSDAERDLRAAQNRLREALDRNAPDDEIRRFTEELRQAMDRFLRELADKMRRDSQEAQEQPDRNAAERMISRDDLNRMLDRMQEAMRRGDMAEAQRLLDELRNVLENLRTARPGNRTMDPLSREMNKSLDELDAMAREQQELRDETFRQGQQGQQNRMGRNGGRPPPGERGQRGQPGQQGEKGEQGQAGDGLGERQQGLRERLEELQRRMKEFGMEGEQGLADAEGAMREAEGALGQGGQEGQAAEAQGRAVEGLRRGAQGLSQQMQQMMGDGSDQAGDQPGNGNPNAQGRANQRDTDPLGRPTRGRNYSDGRVRVPSADESAVERARRIMEELRRRLGDPSRPLEELDYLERLLRRN